MRLTKEDHSHHALRSRLHQFASSRSVNQEVYALNCGSMCLKPLSMVTISNGAKTVILDTLRTARSVLIKIDSHSNTLIIRSYNESKCYAIVWDLSAQLNFLYTLYSQCTSDLLGYKPHIISCNQA